MSSSHRDHASRPVLPILTLVGLLVILLGIWGAFWRTEPLQAAAQGDLASVSLSDSYVLSFQRGTGYAGASDTYLDATDPTANKGTLSEMYIRRNGEWRPIIRFDISVIPPGSVVTQARLELYVSAVGYGDTTKNLDVTAYMLNRAWAETEATWIMATGETDWNTPGADGPISDRLTTVIATKTLRPTDRGQYVHLDVTAAAQMWVNNPQNNHGLILIGASAYNTGYRFAASDNGIQQYRPRLVVNYEGAAPLHTPTPTATLTPTPTPHNLNIIASSVGGCIGAGTGHADRTNVLLFWEGTAWSAELLMDLANVEYEHSIYINDHYVGKSVKNTGGSYCETGRTKQWAFDPAILVNGWNTIRVTNDGAYWDGWTANNIRIRLVGAVVAPMWQDIKYGSHPPNELWAKVQLPIGYTPDTPRPLVVVLHGWSSDVASASTNALLDYAMAANEKGWLLVAPQIVGQHSASIGIQSDMMQVINYMKQNYAVDHRRIYITGTSMGAGIAAVVAAKYPDVFAALAEERGPTDLIEWYYDAKQNSATYNSVMYNEIGDPQLTSFEYLRRSARQLAVNLKHVPVLITHPLSDQIVFVKHGQQFRNALQQYGAEVVEYHEYPGGHGDSFPGDEQLRRYPDGILDFFDRHSLPDTSPHSLHIRNDEALKSYYWLTIRQAIVGPYTLKAHWTEVQTHYDPNIGGIWATVYDDITDNYTSARGYDVYLTFDLAGMGLNTHSSYAVEIYVPETGKFEQQYLSPTDGRLTVHLAGRTHPTHFQVSISAQGMPGTTKQTLRESETYAGTSDTYMVQWQEWDNFGNDEIMTISAGTKSALIRFDLSSLPTPLIVKAAHLYLWTGFGDHGIDVGAYQVLRPWNESEASWRIAQGDTQWGIPGCNDTTSDRLGAPAATTTFSVQDTEYSLNLRDLVQYWVDHPEQNYGVLLRGTGTGSYQIRSSEYTYNASRRPRLEIEYIVATPSPTPTNTMIPTPTASRTPTPTRTQTGTLPASPTPTWTATPTATGTGEPLPTATMTPTFTATATASATATSDGNAVYGYVWYDRDGDGERAANEPPLPGVEISLRIAGTFEERARATTGSDGVYRFTGLSGGQYAVIATVPPGYEATTSRAATGFIPPDMQTRFGMRALSTATITATPTDTGTATATPTQTRTPKLETPTFTVTPTLVLPHAIHLPCIRK